MCLCSLQSPATSQDYAMVIPVCLQLLSFCCIEPYGSSEQSLFLYPFLFFCLPPPGEVGMLMCKYLQEFGPIKRVIKHKSLRCLETHGTAAETIVLAHPCFTSSLKVQFLPLNFPRFHGFCPSGLGPLFRAVPDLKGSVAVFQLLPSQQ